MSQSAFAFHYSGKENDPHMNVNAKEGEGERNRVRNAFLKSHTFHDTHTIFNLEIKTFSIGFHINNEVDEESFKFRSSSDDS